MSIARFLVTAFMLAPIISLCGGCGDTTVNLADVPQVKPAPAVSAEAQPKELRPRPGSSAGITRDPSGVSK